MPTAVSLTIRSPDSHEINRDLRADVFLRTTIDFGANGEGYVRFCFARERKDLLGAIESMARCLRTRTRANLVEGLSDAQSRTVVLICEKHRPHDSG